MGLQLTVVTPTGQAFDGAVDQVVLPGSEGDFGVLEQHERFLAALRPGAVQIIAGGATKWAAIADGFADVSAEAVTVLVSRCDLANAIDAEAARAEVAELEARVESPGALGESSTERATAELELAAARARVDVAGRG